MSGAADFNHVRRVYTPELPDYLRKRIPELAKLKGHRDPQFFKCRNAETYLWRQCSERT